MYSKLLKHEMIATSRIYGLIYIVFAIFTVITGCAGFIHIDNRLLMMIPSFLFVFYVLVLFGVLFSCVAIPPVRFYRHFLTSEGYLTFTLPCTSGQLISVKMLTSMIWAAITLILSAVSAQFVFWSYYKVNALSTIIRSFDQVDAAPLYIGLLVLVFILALFYQYAMFYLSIGIGQLAHNKIAFSIVGYFLVNFLIQIASVIVLFVASLCIGPKNLNSLMESTSGICLFMGGLDLLLLVYGVICMLLTKCLFRRKLNLQ